uniref:Metalloendopeptidase n=1 Tax=Macrostomum lignano TaxID=282301 RepID=A0A1I8HZY4_9PLAT
MLRLLSICVVVGAAGAAPFIDPAAPEYGNEIEGDMIEPFKGAFSGLLNTANRWPGGVIVYRLDSSLPSTTRDKVRTAMTNVNRETGNCIKFREATSNDGSRYVLIRPGSGCSATVGYWGRITYVNLSTSCSVGNIMHEFQHTLGVYHQQSRPDRDNYVTIALENPFVEDPAAPEYGNEIEGDMIEPFKGAFSGLLNTANRWPGGVIVYRLDSSLPSSTRDKVRTAMTNVNRETGNCIKFRQASSSDGSRYVLIRPGSGCSATVGYWGRTTYVNLSTRCSVGNIMHEFQHSLGVYHQQSRPDRDSYVSIALENVRSGYEHNFNKKSSSQVGTYNVRYDFGSQMHYGLTAFSKNGQRTIVPKPGAVPDGVVIGQRSRMAAGDVAILKAMYRC